MTSSRVVVAGFGNVLRGDDGVGVAVSHRLLDDPVPDGVTVMDVGIGGIALVQELLEPADGLVVVDAVDLGRPPGTVLVIRPDVADVTALPVSAQRDALADMHLANPDRALALAAGMGLLPAETWLVGCQPQDADGLGEALSPRLAAAVGPAAAEVRRLVTDLGIPWRDAARP